MSSISESTIVTDEQLAHWCNGYSGLTLAETRAVQARLNQEISLREAAIAAKDNAYSERNRLVALLASMYKSSLCQTDIPNWEPDWHWCIFIETPEGQLSWHIHDSELPLFSHIPRRAAAWDGHTTEEKYRRVDALASSKRIDINHE